MTFATSSLATLMHQPLVVTDAGTSVSDAFALAKDNGIHHLPVIDKDQLVGMVCTCDLYQAPAGAMIADVMKAPITLLRDNSAFEAAYTMRQHAVGSIVVTDQGKPLGIVTRGDLLEQFPNAEQVMGPSRCQCCGLTRHLQTDAYGQTLCVLCRERGCEDAWFEDGDGD